MKSPEEYFLERPLLPEEQAGEPSEAEKLFLRKYMGLGAETAKTADAVAPRVDPERIAVFAPEPVKSAKPVDAATPAPAPAADAPQPVLEQPAQSQAAPKPAKPGAAAQPQAEQTVGLTAEDIAADQRMAGDLQLVGFKLGTQEYALPIGVIQEVIRFTPPTKLPTAPSFLAGMINLRGKVTPLVRPLQLMGKPIRPEDEDRFIVVCRRKGLQVGLIIQAVSTMYRPAENQIEWNIEAQVGITSDYLAALIKNGDALIAVLSLDRIVDKVLKG